MKKISTLILVLTLCLAMMIPLHTTAASASGSLTGPDVIRAGDTITLSFNLGGNGVLGASGTLSYDSNQLTLTGTSQKIASPWVVEFNGNNFVAYDNNLTNPINGTKTLFTVSFKVKSLSAGTSVKVSYTGVTASDGNADANVGTVTYSKTVAAPLATNNDLASLTVSNATISPTFSTGTTNYTASVPFEVSKLDVKATAADSKAKVSVNSPNLVPAGTTNVTVTVTAENGAKKTYTIAVSRAKDPNYQASGNNNLSGISVEGFLLSPVFTPENTQYVIWLPYETESVKIGGSAADSKASVAVEGGETLAAGQDNIVKVICTAENGDKKEYIITVKRAAAHDGSVEDLPEDTSSDTDLPTTDTTTDLPTSTAPQTPVVENNGLAWWWLIVVGVGGLAIGFVVAFLIFKSPKKKDAN